MSPGWISRILPLVLIAILIGLTGGASDRARSSAIVGPLSTATEWTEARRGAFTGSSVISSQRTPARLAPGKSFIGLPHGEHLRFPAQKQFVPQRIVMVHSDEIM